jgi:hypothetical protein
VCVSRYSDAVPCVPGSGGEVVVLVGTEHILAFPERAPFSVGLLMCAAQCGAGSRCVRQQRSSIWRRRAKRQGEARDREGEGERERERERQGETRRPAGRDCGPCLRCPLLCYGALRWVRYGEHGNKG